MAAPDFNKYQQQTEVNLIEAVLHTFFIVDYGFIAKVNDDGSVNVTHAKKQTSVNGTVLPDMTTKNLEMLTLSAGALCIKYTVKAGDKVLLLGLKNYVENTADVSQATEQSVFLHYKRETMKVLPFSAINADAEVTIEAAEGKLLVTTDSTVEINGTDNGGLCITPELKTQLDKATARIDGIMNALKNSQTAAQDGGAAYKAGITAALAKLTDKEDYSHIESNKVLHGTGGE